MPNPPEIVEQYRLVRTVGGLHARSDRGLLEVTGKDRAAWLNNLVTNVVKTLAPGEGNYAFATNVKGRVVFDMNLLALEDRLWLDLDARLVAAAMKHLDRYIITEDVNLSDASSSLHRLAVLGPAAAEVAAQAGFGNLPPMASLQHVAGSLAGTAVRLVRNDFAGLTTAEFFMAAEGAASARSALESARPLPSLDHAVVEVLRIEAGIPRSVDDIDDEVLPPETGQIERGISYHKGCYLGQEVIERMRSHHVLARTLVALRVEGDADVPPGSAVRLDDKEVGRTRSACWSEGLQSALALAYVKTAQSKTGTCLFVAADPAPRRCAVVPTPAAG